MPESMRRRLEALEDAHLAPWALRSADATRRLPVEDEGRAFDYRSQFQRDRDRIVYSRAFRRLRHKAVAGILPDYEDHRRNRLTHTLEVTQLARTFARALRLNEDLVEAIALGHDLGQPPFGAAGRRALDDLLSGRLDGRGGPALGDLGGFRRAWQGLRVVDLLEKRYEHAGLNLTDDVREGIVKCERAPRPLPSDVTGVRAGLAPAFEVQVVRLADRVGSALGDLDDALQAAHVAPAEVERLGAVRELQRKLGSRWRPRAGRFAKANAIHRGLTHLLATSAIAASERRLARWGATHEVRDALRFRTLRDDAVQGDEISLPPAVERMLADLEGFLAARARRGYAADQLEARGRHAVLGVFAAYQADATLLPDHLLLRYKELSGGRYLRDVPRPDVEAQQRHYRSDPRFARVLSDHIAAMTDAYLVAEQARLLAAGAVPMPSVEQLRRES